jgi:hypothetical protein
MIEGLTACFAGLLDPRVTRRCDRRLIDVRVIAVSACAESWCRARCRDASQSCAI